MSILDTAYIREYYGIYRGIVEDNEDPENLGRCRVRVFAVHGPLNYPVKLLPWARPIVPTPVGSTANSLGSDTKRGSVNIPDKGDIVFVFFEGGKRDYPLYFGGTYSKKDINVNKDEVNLYTEIYLDEENMITYNRKNQGFTIKSGTTELQVLPTGVEIIGNLRVSGDMEISGAAFGSDDGVFTTDRGFVEGSDLSGEGSPSGTATYDQAMSTHTPGSWLWCVETVKYMLASTNGGYSQSSYLKYDFPTGTTYTARRDCSGTVSAMLGLFLRNQGGWKQCTSYIFASSNTVIPGFNRYPWTGWQSLETGDIIAINGHVEVYAYTQNGVNYVWNAGSSASVNNPKPTRTGHSTYTCYYRNYWSGDLVDIGLPDM